MIARLAGIDETIPVVVLSGDEARGTAGEAVRRGAFDYVCKGLGDPDPLLEAVARAAQHARRLRGRRTRPAGDAAGPAEGGSR